ncbi:Regulator of microtubule dynamics 2 [Gossypium arboreum]|uniref:Regulator of microtubule dynamics 2 n=1 Tax=Gossypium arboreum TaxID=29729 RepID=A0A0B0P9Q8_GOSAR|nr:Regulator of microtubule dynamics 2 [Gossypium arboreum]
MPLHSFFSPELISPFSHLLSFSNYFWLIKCYLDCGTPASIVFLMGVHILPFFEIDVGRKAHINLYLL